jgi:alkylhydroperoxidase family enzyme
LSGRLREILIIRVGWRLGSDYILKQHIPKLAEPEGLDPDACAALLKDNADYFSGPERAAISLADELTLSACLSDNTTRELKSAYNDRMLVEMMVLVSTYNMHARFVAGLDIDLEPD